MNRYNHHQQKAWRVQVALLSKHSNMKRIVAATDFKPVSINAARYAAELARWRNAVLHLVHVSPFPVMLNDIPVPFPAEEEDAAELMKGLKDRLLEEAGSRISITTAILSGTTITEILHYCREQGPDVLVMGAETRTGIERLVAAITLEAISRIHIPLLIVPQNAAFCPVKRIGLACDLTKAIDKLPLMQIETLVKEFGAELHVVHVSDRRADFTADEMEEALVLRLALEGMKPHFSFVGGDNAVAELAKLLSEEATQMVIVVRRNHNLVGKMLHHSFAGQMATHSRVPLIVLHEPA